MSGLEEFFGGLVGFADYAPDADNDEQEAGDEFEPEVPVEAASAVEVEALVEGEDADEDGDGAADFIAHDWFLCVRLGMRWR